MMTIVKDRRNLTNAEIIFNQRICEIRSLIERTIGVLKMRFRCILGERKLRYSPTKASQIFYSCVTLHNFLIFNGFDIFHDIPADQLNDMIAQQNQMPIMDGVGGPIPAQTRAQAIVLRNHLIQHINNQLNN